MHCEFCLTDISVLTCRKKRSFLVFDGILSGAPLTLCFAILSQLMVREPPSLEFAREAVLGMADGKVADRKVAILEVRAAALESHVCHGQSSHDEHCGCC